MIALFRRCFCLFMVAVCPNNHEMALRFASFRYIKTIWFGCKTGAMNLPLRLAECSLPYICVINGYCGVFADIHFAHDKWFVRCMLDILLYVKTPFLHYKKVVFKKTTILLCVLPVWLFVWNIYNFAILKLVRLCPHAYLYCSI